jgi:hypothetical protein
VDVVDVVLQDAGIDEKFLGVTLFALVPNTTEFMNAISFALNGNIALRYEVVIALIVHQLISFEHGDWLSLRTPSMSPPDPRNGCFLRVVCPRQIGVGRRYFHVRLSDYCKARKPNGIVL